MSMKNDVNSTKNRLEFGLHTIWNKPVPDLNENLLGLVRNPPSISLFSENRARIGNPGKAIIVTSSKNCISIITIDNHKKETSLTHLCGYVSIVRKVCAICDMIAPRHGNIR